MDAVQGLESAVVDKLVELGLSYLSKDPEQNLANLLDLGERLARKPEHRQMIAHFASLLAERPSLREYVRRVLTEVHPNYRKRFLLNLIVHASLLGIPRQQEMGAQLGVNVPYTILIDPTEACNLRCNGCWAGKYEVHTLPYPVLKRVLDEARELGIHFIVLSGGEPFAYPHLIRMAQEYPDIAFMLYTNGTLIDEEMADQMQAVGNLSPAISLEGWRHTTDARRGPGVFDRVMQAMDLLKERGVIFGFSVTVTRHNAAEVFSDEFMDFMVEKGALYGWSFHYIPVGRDPDLDLLLEPEQRLWLAERVVQIRETKPLMVMDFWNDGELTQGCIAGGRRYFHITADGGVEPCAFVHFRVDNIKEKSLREVLGSPFFRSYQKHQPTSGNLLMPCPLIDRPAVLRHVIKETGAQPSHEGADNILQKEMADFLDARAAKWARVSAPLWRRRVEAKGAGRLLRDQVLEKVVS